MNKGKMSREKKPSYFGDNGGIDVLELSPFAKEQRENQRKKFWYESKKAVIRELNEAAEKLEEALSEKE